MALACQIIAVSPLDVELVLLFIQTAIVVTIPPAWSYRSVISGYRVMLTQIVRV